MFWKRLNEELPEMAEAIRELLLAKETFAEALVALVDVLEMVEAALPNMPAGMGDLWAREKMIIELADPAAMSKELRCSLCPLGELGIKKLCPDALITDLEGTELGEVLRRAKEGGLPC